MNITITNVIGRILATGCSTNVSFISYINPNNVKIKIIITWINKVKSG